VTSANEERKGERMVSWARRRADKSFKTIQSWRTCRFLCW